ncbi:MAG: TonB-dependent receptor [Verrucomicrobia bacterium]|nr:TonB-dependent receptor [Verrucomicrobiota bacterium]
MKALPTLPVAPTAVPLHRSLVPWLACAFAALPAQVSPPARPDPEDTIVRLSEFEVSTQRDTTYRAASAVSSNRANTPLFETPQSITVLTEAFLRDIEALSVTEALEFIPGVTPGDPGTGGADTIQTRGQAIPETLLDNMPDLNTNVRPDPALIERVEFIKGSSSSLYGSSWPGGVVNSITKRPKAKPAYEFALQFGSYDLRRETIDLTGPLAQNRSLLYRLVLAYEESGSYRDRVNSDRWTALPALSYAFASGAKITVSHEYLHSRQTADPFLPIFTGDTQVRLPRERFLGLPDQDYDIIKRATRVFFDHRLNAHWSLRLGYAYSTIIADKMSGQLTGQASATTRTQPRRINRQYITTGTQVLQGDVLGRFVTGPFAHRTLIGFDVRKQQNDLATYFQNITPATVNVDNPSYTYALNGAVITNIHNVAFSESYGAYVQNQASVWQEKLQLVVGARLDGLSQDTLTLTQPRRTSYTPPNVITPRYALLFHPTKDTMLYATYGESFRPDVSGRPIFGTTAKLDPTTGVLHEIGGKSRFFDGRLAFEVDLFELTREGIVVADPDHTGFVLQSGKERSRGYSASFHTDPLPGLTFFGGYAYTDGKIVSDSNRTLIGRRLQGTPKHSFNAFAKYRVRSGPLQGLGCGAGVRWVDDRPGATNTTLTFPGYTVVNAQVNYAWRRYSFNVAVNNLFDEYYWANVAALNGNRAGLPLSYRASVRAKF